MKEKIYKCVLFFLGLVVLQQGIVFSREHFVQLEQQMSIIEQNNIDPSALFYMESKLALEAEKAVRKQLYGN